MPTNETAHIYSSEYADATPTAASAVTYDNTTSGLTADDVQEAIDEVNGKFADISQFPTLSSESADGTYIKGYSF